MKIKELKAVCVVDKPLNVLDEIREKATTNQVVPFYICDLTDIIKKHRIWTQLLPRVIPFYAVKANDNPMVIKLLAALGTGFDCASMGEIKKVRDIGVSSSRIIFANPAKPALHLEYALGEGVDTMTFDSEFELNKIQKCYPNARLVLRIRYDAEVALCRLGEKFGCDPELEAPMLLNIASKMGLQVVGISFHVGSGCKDFPVYAKAIYAAKKLFDYAESLGFCFNLLDIGGGFPGDKNTSIVELSEIINSSIEQHFPNDSVTIISEPGRYFVSSALTLATTIHSKREVHRNGTLLNTMYFINDGAFGSFLGYICYHRPIDPKPIKQYEGGSLKSSIWGPTCDSWDQVCESILLPKMQIGDVLMFENMGAYTFVIASTFNGFPLPNVIFYIEREYLDEINKTSDIMKFIES